jgi:hypothetical protein
MHYLLGTYCLSFSFLSLSPAGGTGNGNHAASHQWGLS